MTNQERAEKIAAIFDPDPTGFQTDFVRSQLDEAVREACDLAVKNDRILAAHGAIKFREGFAAAREKAAGIADIGENDSADCCWVAERIRAMEADK